MTFKYMLESEKKEIIKRNEHYKISDADHRIFILHQHYANTGPKSVRHISTVKCNIAENINILQALGYILKVPALCVGNNIRQFLPQCYVA